MDCPPLRLDCLRFRPFLDFGEELPKLDWQSDEVADTIRLISVLRALWDNTVLSTLVSSHEACDTHVVDSLP